MDFIRNTIYQQGILFSRQKQMLDLYMIIVPIFGILTIAGFVILKGTLSEPKKQDLKHYEKKRTQSNEKTQQQTSQQQSSFKKTYLYLLKNFTLAEVCTTRRNRNKIPLLVSISAVGLLVLLINVPYIFCFVGAVIFIIFAFGKMLTDTQNEEEMTFQKVKANEEKSQNKIQVFFVGLALALNILIMFLTYKNYYNEILSAAALNFLITIALDNLIVRPVALAIFAYPIRNVQFIDSFIKTQNQIVEILQQERVKKRIIDAAISAISPKKLRTSPTKVPKATMEVEPRVSNKQNYLNTLDLTKNMRKPKLSPLSLKKRNVHDQQGDCSLISILNSNQKKKKDPNSRSKNISFDFDKTFEQKCEQFHQKDFMQVQQPIEDEFSASKIHFQSRKKNKLYSSKMIIVNPDSSIIDNIDIDNQQEEDNTQNKKQNENDRDDKSLKDSGHNKSNKNCDILRVSIHNSIDGDNNDFQDGQNDYQNRPNSTLQEECSVGQNGANSSRRRHNLLKISEDRNAQDLEEIDLNSPERRKSMLSKIDEEKANLGKSKKKKPHKKYSLDPNRHVIKHTTGQPYLQYLPKLLSKQRQQKIKRSQQQASQQQFSRKIDFMNTNQTRLIQSVKRSKKSSKDPIVRGNDQNRIPQFIIEDFA